MKTKTTNISVDRLHTFKDHPYKVEDNDDMNALVESIREHGILTPLIVRPLEGTADEYEIISGHRRHRAAQKAGITEIPAFIYAVSREAAAVMVVDSNLHREKLLPSEKAFAYKMKADALKHQGQRSDLTLAQIAPKCTAAMIAEQEGVSKDTVKRYIRLTNLIPELLDLMDDGKMAFSVGVELSYLDDQRQYDVLEAIEQNNGTPSYSQAVRLHKVSNTGELTREMIETIISEEKPNQRETVKVPAERVKSLIPNSFTSKQAEDYIVKALEHYQKYLRRQRDAR